MDPGPTLRIPKVKTGATIDKPGESVEKETGGSRLSGVTARLSSVDSFKSDRCSTVHMTSESNENNVFLFQYGNIQRLSTSSKSPRSPFETSKNFVSFSVPSSRIVSRSPSPVPRMSNPLKSATPSPPLSFRTSDDMKSYNDSLSQEVKRLRAQVEELSCKTQLLEAELHGKSKQLNEITLRVEDEVCKNKAAEELIKSLTSQVKEMAEREQQITCRNFDTIDQITDETNRTSNGSSVTIITSPKSECGDNPTPPPISNGTKSSQIHKSEHIMQDEPGVYITLISLPDGVNELRRIRFSRKRFTKQQAEKWWAENETRVCRLHNIQSVQ